MGKRYNNNNKKYTVLAEYPCFATEFSSLNLKYMYIFKLITE